MQTVSIRKFLFKKYILGKFFFLTSWKECHLKEYSSSPFLRVSKFVIHFLQTTAREKFNLQKKMNISFQLFHRNQNHYKRKVYSVDYFNALPELG